MYATLSTPRRGRFSRRFYIGRYANVHILGTTNLKLFQTNLDDEHAVGVNIVISDIAIEVIPDWNTESGGRAL